MKYIDLHQGMGDQIVCVGLVEELARNEEVVICAKDHYIASVESFYRGVAGVGIVSDSHIAELRGKFETLYVGAGGKTPYNCNYVKWFYRNAGIKCERTYTDRLQKSADKVGQYPIPAGKYIFLHENGNDGNKPGGYMIDRKKVRDDLKIIVPAEGGSILRYARLLKFAEEIHVIDSSFYHLAQRVETMGKIFYHTYARPGSVTDYEDKKPVKCVN